jgi:CHAT domain-containing protein
VPALGLLSQLRNRPPREDGTALVVGNPLGDLEYAETEARGVAAMLGTRPLLREQATKCKVQATLSEATVIHLAAHARFNPASPLDSGVVLASEEILTAYEVMDQRLQADLLILSACETGMAQSLGGDELASLGQAFLQAGARSVIVSLWNVNDSATAALMKSFYEGRRAGVDKAQALSQAMTQIREQEKWRHPYYWGAFVLMGDW